MVSAKLMKLQSLFGEDAELDVAAMLIKEPRLAATDIRVDCQAASGDAGQLPLPLAPSLSLNAWLPLLYTILVVGSYAMQSILRALRRCCPVRPWLP